MPASPAPKDDQGKPEPGRSEDQRTKNLKSRMTSLYTKWRPLFAINLAWFLLSLPLITLFPALGSLYHAVSAFNQGKTPGWNSVWEGFKTYGWLSAKWGLAVMLGYALAGGAMWYLNSLEQDWTAFASAAAGAFLFLWTAINQFSLPMLFQQSEQKVWIAIRNGYVLAIRQPFSALKTLLLTWMIAAFSTLLAPSWVFISMALIAHIQTRATLAAVEKIKSQDAENDTAQAYRAEHEVQDYHKDQGKS